jgi:hypothetical protein
VQQRRLGIGLALPTLGSAAAATLPAAHYALGSAINATARQLGAVLGVSMLVAIIGTAPPSQAMAAFDRTWTAIGIVSLGAAIASLALRRPPNSAPAAQGAFGDMRASIRPPSRSAS